MEKLEKIKTPTKTVQKAWGWEEWLVNEDKYCAKLLVLNPASGSSRHYHPVKQETFIVESGIVALEIGNEVLQHFTLVPGESITLPPKTPHRFLNKSANKATILEISMHHDDGDVVRLTESFGPRSPK